MQARGVPPDHPAAVLHANRVIAASRAARADGVHVGQRRRDAQARCPSLAVLTPDPARDAQAFDAVIAALDAVTPAVEVVEPGHCAFPTLGPSRWSGGDEALAAKVRRAVRAVVPDPDGVGVGVAEGRFAAGLAAHTDAIVPPGCTPAFLAPFGVDTLGDDDLASLLRRLGIFTLGAFASLGAADVLGRFGADGAARHRMAAGVDERPLAVRHPPPELAVTIELDPPVDRIDTVAFSARAAADALVQRLADRGMACVRVVVEADTEHGERLRRTWGAEVAFTPAALIERVRWQIEGWLAGPAAGRPTAGLTLLRLVPDLVVADNGRQLGFWGGTGDADDRAVRAVARLQGLLGPEGVLVAEHNGGRAPAEQLRLLPASTVDLRERIEAAQVDPFLVPGHPARHRRSSLPRGAAGARPKTPERHHRSTSRQTLPPEPDRPDQPWPGRMPMPSPALVHDPPLVAQVVDAADRSVIVDGRGLASDAPTRVSIGGDRWVTVTGWAGPWATEERWWDPSQHRRRARFQVTLDDGRALLLVLERGAWAVEATYD